LQLARNPSELAGLRERLEKNRLTAPLFDSERFTRHLERAYRMMWDIYASGDAPRRIEVPVVQDGVLAPPSRLKSRKRKTNSE
jgi:hypothetical protein